MTAERMRWHCEALDTAVSGGERPVPAGANIHTDDEIARSSGLPGRVADGMISTNWLSSMLIQTFGDGYLWGGSLRTRYTKPVFVDDVIRAVIRVAALDSDEDGRAVARLDVWCENQHGDVCTTGEAVVRLPPD
jgi:acyl dehydratase